LQFGQGLEFVTSHRVFATVSVSGHSETSEKKELNYINVTTIAALQGRMAHTNPAYPSSGSNQSNLLSNMTYYCLKWPGIVQLVKEKHHIHFALPNSDRYIQ